jgi:hypothetical protein
MVAALGGRPGLRRACRGVPYGVCERQEVIRPGLLWCGRHGQPQHFPATWDCKRIGVLFTEVVAVRLGIGGQRTQDGGGVCIHVRQGCYRRLAAGGP